MALDFFDVPRPLHACQHAPVFGQPWVVGWYVDTMIHTHSPSGDRSQWPGFRYTVDSQTLSMRPVEMWRTSMKGILLRPFQPK